MRINFYSAMLQNKYKICPARSLDRIPQKNTKTFSIPIDLDKRHTLGRKMHLDFKADTER